MEYSVIEFAKFAAYVVIFGFLWRSLAAYLVGKDDGTSAQNVGKAMGFIY